MPTVLPSDTAAAKIGFFIQGFQAFASAISALDTGSKFHAFLVGIQLYLGRSHVRSGESTILTDLSYRLVERRS